MAKSPINEQHSSADLVTVKKNFNLTFLIISLQGSRLTFQLASPVASDRFDSLAKTVLVPSLKNTALVFLEIFLNECCTVLVKPPMTS